MDGHCFIVLLQLVSTKGFTGEMLYREQIEWTGALPLSVPGSSHSTGAPSKA